jgi:O-acetylhomoserine (thiol)-lyase
MSEDELEAAGIKANVIRLSIGLEDTVDLIADLKQAIES